MSGDNKIKLGMSLFDDKEKLAYALSSSGYCPGDFNESMPSCNLEGHCIPENDKCKDCWEEHL